VKPWLRECSYFVLAAGIWLLSMALPPSAVVQAAGVHAGVGGPAATVPLPNTAAAGAALL